VIGFLLGDWAPHFLGAAGKAFGSPFGQRSLRRTSILWGLSSIATTLIGLSLAALGDFSYSLAALPLGFWLRMLPFGTRIKRFLNDRP
jgi:hypothetical protein